MNSWTTRALVAATLLTGCTGEIGNPAPGQGAGDGPGAGPGSGLTPGMNVDTDGDGVADGVGIDSDGDGIVDGVDSDGDGVIDRPVTTTENPTSSTTCTPGIPATSQLPRLTGDQYDNTIRDLVGLETQPSSMLAPDTVGSVDQRAWDGYKTAAAEVAAEIMADPNARARAIPCTPDTDGTACAQQMVESFGQRAFRRPLTADEVTRFMNLYTNRAAITETGTFDETAELMLKAFLLSPSFLTRAETSTAEPNGQLFALSDYEIANRLSYLIWGSMPDDALFAAAAAGSLSTSEGILAEAQRMLTDPKARGMVGKFHESYLHMGAGTRWADYQRDTTRYPMFNDSLIPTFSRAEEKFFDYVVFDQGGSFKDLMTSPVAFVNASTAPIYGLDATQFGSDLTAVTLDGSRPGAFTRAGFLASHSSFDRTSPILRGAFIQKEVLCTQLGTPPPGATSTPLPTEGLTTNRERTDAQTADAACAGCHYGYINPTGFALEGFDAIGAVQTTDNGAPVDSTSTVPMGDEQVPVTGAVDLMNALATSEAAQKCYAQKWVQYAYERDINSMDACTVDLLASNLTQDGYTVLNLISDLTQTESFRYRAMEVAQ